jgi:hypothetical protein
MCQLKVQIQNYESFVVIWPAAVIGSHLLQATNDGRSPNDAQSAFDNQ